jgi:alpha-ketoglutarate-dependent taurine dioxygenase
MSNPRQYRLPGGLIALRTQPAIGAVVSGIDLAQKIEARQSEGLRQALFAHGVIFLRGQDHIGYPEHLALAEVFGEPHSDGHEPERPEIMAIRSKAHNPEGIASVWHFDDPYMIAPPAVSVLRAIEPSTFGGDTCFSSAAAAYAGLPSELKEQIAGLRYSTSLEALITEGPGGFGADDTWRELIARNPPLTQPLVIVHPGRGRRHRIGLRHGCRRSG